MPQDLPDDFSRLAESLDALCRVPPKFTDKPRHVFYIPFENVSIPETTSLRRQAEAERNVVMIRAFANAVNRELTPPEPDEQHLEAATEMEQLPEDIANLANSEDGQSVVDDDDWDPVHIEGYTEFPSTDYEPDLDYNPRQSLTPYVVKFNRLDDAAQMRVLEAVANKKPTIIQHEGPENEAALPEGFKLHPRDVINVMAHGRNDRDQIGSVAARVDGRQMIAATELIQRMKQDLGGTLTNIKLHICGSAGTFQGAFTRACKDTHSFPWAQVRGYNKAELVEFTQTKNALKYLDRGSKTVRDPESLTAYDNAKDSAKIARLELNSAIEEADFAKGAVARALQEQDLAPDSDEVTSLVAAAKAANLFYEQKREAFDQAKTRFLAAESDLYAPAKDNKVIIKVRDALGSPRPAASTSTGHGLGR